VKNGREIFKLGDVGWIYVEIGSDGNARGGDCIGEGDKFGVRWRLIESGEEQIFEMSGQRL